MAKGPEKNTKNKALHTQPQKGKTPRREKRKSGEAQSFGD